MGKKEYYLDWNIKTGNWWDNPQDILKKIKSKKKNEKEKRNKS